MSWHFPMSTDQPWVMAVQADTVGADERERLARLASALIADRTDCILLNTCHRVELYGFGALDELDPRFQIDSGERAVRHLIRVAAGLESAIVGEDEVLHQVREAIAHARASHPMDHRLQRLFETAIAAGRSARAGRTAYSGNLAQRAVAWLQGKSPLAGRTVLVVGAGRMGSSLAHSARLAGAEVTIASRDPARARRLARVYGGPGVDLAGGAELAPRSAGVAVALAGIWREFRPDPDFPPIADISAPPAIPAAVRANLNGGFLGIDDLYSRTQALPGAYIEKAEQIIAVKTREYVGWLDARN